MTQEPRYAASETDDELPALSGWMAKRHRSEKGSTGVDDASGFLHYAAAERKKPSLSIDLSSITSVVPSDRPESEKISYLTERGLNSSKNSTSAAYGLEICTAAADANLYVFALTADAARTWLRGLRARAGLVGGVAPSPLDAGAHYNQDATGGDDSSFGPVAEGWLSKQNTAKGGARTQGGGWVKRYFRLELTGVLSYASSETALDARKSVPLSTIAAVAQLAPDAEAARAAPSAHCLQLTLCSGKTVQLCAFNAEDLRMWLRVLGANLDALRSAAATNRRRASASERAREADGAPTAPDGGSSFASARSDDAADADGTRRGAARRIKVFKPDVSTRLGLTLTSPIGSRGRVEVTHLAPDSVGQDSELEVGMTLLQVNATRVFTDRQATDLLRSLHGELTLLVLPPGAAEDADPAAAAASASAAAASAAAAAASAAAAAPAESRPAGTSPQAPPARPADAYPARTLGVPRAPPSAATPAAQQGAPPPHAAAASAGAPTLTAALGGGGHFYLQPIDVPAGLALPAGLPPGGQFVYIVPLPPAGATSAPPDAPAQHAAKHTRSNSHGAGSAAVALEARGRAIRGSPLTMSAGSASPLPTDRAAAAALQASRHAGGTAPEVRAPYVEDDVLEQSLESSIDLRT